MSGRPKLDARGTECIEGAECGPELVERSGQWCCFWCGMPIPLAKKGGA